MPTRDKTQQLLEAISLATRAHQGQHRIDGKTPYVAHPLRVTIVLRHVFGVDDPATLTAGALHDTIEDTTVDRDVLIKRFGTEVASYVAALSKDKRLPEAEREAHYVQALVDAPLPVKLCKLADVYDNLTDAGGRTPAARRKFISRTQEILARFEPDLSPAWDHVLASVREKIAIAQQWGQ